MAQLTKGARVVLDHFDADLSEIKTLALQLSLPDIKNNPHLVQEILNEIAMLAQRALRRLDTDLAPMLQRQQSKLEEVELTERMAALEQMLRTLVHNQSSPD
jgi:hypothetical protein